MRLATCRSLWTSGSVLARPSCWRLSQSFQRRSSKSSQLESRQALMGCRTTEGFGAVSVNAVSVNRQASASIDEPVNAVSVNRQVSASIDELVDTLQGMMPEDLSWLVDRLKECARAVANGNVPGRITEMKRSKEFTQGQREAIDAGSALKLDEVEKLINLLDSERQPYASYDRTHSFRDRDRVAVSPHPSQLPHPSQAVLWDSTARSALTRAKTWIKPDRLIRLYRERLRETPTFRVVPWLVR